MPVLFIAICFFLRYNKQKTEKRRKYIWNIEF